jgi:NAD(P)-dependent dehydrogenase (short-subunit alcohol dehydrogenase family)
MMTRTVLVTGASSGIGRACAIALKARGFRVFAGVRKSDDAEAARTASLTPVMLDVTEESSVAEAVASMDADTLDGLVNNAGINVSGPLEFLPMEDIRRQFDVNLFGQIAVTKAFLPMLRRAKGRIVNMSSISGLVASPMLGPYAMSKFALEAFSDSLRRELRPLGVEVICVEPGAIATPIWDKALSRARERVDKLSSEAAEVYGPTMDAVRRSAENMAENAAPVEKVTRVVLHALTSSNPKTRYLVGKDARLAARLARFLPDRWLDRLLLQRLGV